MQDVLSKLEKTNIMKIRTYMGVVVCRRVPRARAGYTRGGRRVRRARVQRVDGYDGHG
jgi:hypothetical protein